jgi:hypothetical protein
MRDEQYIKSLLDELLVLVNAIRQNMRCPACPTVIGKRKYMSFFVNEEPVVKQPLSRFGELAFCPHLLKPPLMNMQISSICIFPNPYSGQPLPFPFCGFFKQYPRLAIRPIQQGSIKRCTF